MSPAEEQNPVVTEAARRAQSLIDAFKYIIKYPDAHKPTHEERACIESCMNERRRDIFWDKWKDYEALPKEGFFTHYLRPSTLKYKASNYEQLDFLSQCLEKIQQSSPVNMKEALMALSDISYRLIVDGGKNAVGNLDANKPEDAEYVRGKNKVKTGKMTPLEYIRNWNDRIIIAAGKANLTPKDYTIKRNHEVNRRKDVLQVLVAELAVQLNVIQNALTPAEQTATIQNPDISPAALPGRQL